MKTPKINDGLRDEAGNWIYPNQEMLIRLKHALAVFNGRDRLPIKSLMSKRVKTKDYFKITPEMALVFLAANFYNRTIKEDNVWLYAQKLLNGDSTPDTVIKVYVTGNFYDGCHRLLACYMANLPLICSFQLGVPLNADVDSKSAARTDRAASGYLSKDGKPVDGKIIAAGRSILRSFKVPRAELVQNGTPWAKLVITGYPELFEKYLEAMRGLEPQIPGCGKNCSDLLAALVTVAIVDPRAADRFVTELNPDTRTHGRVMNWLQVYMEGEAVIFGNNHCDRINRFKAFLQVILTLEMPKDGANGFADKEFTDDLARAIWKQCKIHLQISDADRQPTKWQIDRDHFSLKDRASKSSKKHSKTVAKHLKAKEQLPVKSKGPTKDFVVSTRIPAEFVAQLEKQHGNVNKLAQKHLLSMIKDAKGGKT